VEQAKRKPAGKNPRHKEWDDNRSNLAVQQIKKSTRRTQENQRLSSEDEASEEERPTLRYRNKRDQKSSDKNSKRQNKMLMEREYSEEPVICKIIQEKGQFGDRTYKVGY